MGEFGPTILLAPDKFKGSLTAAAVAHQLASGIRSQDPTFRVRECPIADGGEGTVAAALAAGWRRRSALVDGPTGSPVEATYAVRGRAAVIELAESCGLQRLPAGTVAPWTASSYGLGQNLAVAVADGALSVTIGLGGSASTDGGAGLLRALGARIRAHDGTSVERGAGHLRDVASVDLAPARKLLAGVRLVAACDVTNPLLGLAGAAHTYGLQKGFRQTELDDADDGLRALSRAVAAHTDLTTTSGAGAAGGAGFALLALGAHFRPGIDVVAGLTGLEERIAAADLVVIGEGKLDEQSLTGKGPIGVAERARSRDVPVVAVVGRNALTQRRADSAGLNEVMDLLALEPDPEASQIRAATLLCERGRHVAQLADRLIVRGDTTGRSSLRPRSPGHRVPDIDERRERGGIRGAKST